MGKEKGFLEGLLSDLMLFAIVQDSKNSKGKPDPYKASALAALYGRTSTKDIIQLGSILEDQGAFKKDPPEISSISYDDILLAILADQEAWRENCPDGSRYGLDHNNFETEKEYMDAYSYAETEWSDAYTEAEEYGLDVSDCQTLDDLQSAVQDEREYLSIVAREYGLDPDVYWTLSELQEAINEAQDSAFCEDEEEDAAEDPEECDRDNTNCYPDYYKEDYDIRYYAES